MDYKVKINQAFDELERLVGAKGAYNKLRESIEKETNPATLFLKYQSLKEQLKKMDPESPIDVSFTIQLPSGEKKRFGTLDEFFEDAKTQAEMKEYVASIGRTG